MMGPGVSGVALYAVDWSRTAIDAVAGAEPDTLFPSATWTWDGPLWRLDAALGPVRLEGAIGRAALHRMAAGRVARFMRRDRPLTLALRPGGTSWATPWVNPTAQGAASAPAEPGARPAGVPAPATSLRGGFVVTDGRRAWSVVCVPGGFGARRLALFAGAVPPQGRDLWVVSLAGTGRARVDTGADARAGGAGRGAAPADPTRTAPDPRDARPPRQVWPARISHGRVPPGQSEPGQTEPGQTEPGETEPGQTGHGNGATGAVTGLAGRPVAWGMARAGGGGLRAIPASVPVPLRRPAATGFTAGTLIETPIGPTPVERLRPGDLVLTDRGAAPLRAVRLCPAVPSLRVVPGLWGEGGPMVAATMGRDTWLCVEGTAVDTLFGVSEALVRVRDLDLLPGLPPPLRADLIALTLDGAPLIMADGWPCLSATVADDPRPDMRALSPGEAQIALAHRPARLAPLQMLRGAA